MDVSAIAAAAVAAQAAQTQAALAAKFMKMGAEQQQSVAALLEAAAQNGAKISAAVQPGVGGTVDRMV
jgi:hypothetical protein